MAPRALRRLQREQEERRRLDQIEGQKDATEGDSESSDESSHEIHKKNQKSAFELLGQVEESEPEPEAPLSDVQDEDDLVNGQRGPEQIDQTVSQRSGKKKSRKKKKGKATPTTSQRTQSANLATDASDGRDEIDLALDALRLKSSDAAPSGPTQDAALELQKFYTLLSTDSRHLNALTEMKRLFGASVLDTSSDQDGPRRRDRGPLNLDLQAALSARYSPVSKGQGMSGLALRRNAFVPGKEDWPRATSGGLGMEMVEQAWDHTTEYRLVHTPIYQATQREFEVAVEALDPQRMIFLLQFNPYHISTLLQTSEIAKQQGDHAVAADLLERALFTFGRSVNSAFTTALSQGKARLDFRRPENREFWLSAYRYTGTLGQRGTWRTAFEWSKLLLSLDPEGDPYRQRLVIDQLALRGRQLETFIALAETDPAVIDWGQRSPNIQISLGLAHARLKHPREARAILGECVAAFPWIFARLLKELNIERIPKSVWGTTPRTPLEELQTESYATRATRSLRGCLRSWAACRASSPARRPRRPTRCRRKTTCRRTRQARSSKTSARRAWTRARTRMPSARSRAAATSRPWRQA